MRQSLFAAAATVAATLLSAQQQGRKPVFTPVKPVVASQGRGAGTNSGAAGAQLQIGAGRFFSYALPQGWRVGEDGQFALTLHAPDAKAVTVMVGNAGLPPNYPPDRFVYEKLMALQPQNLRLSPPRRATPVAGFAEAYAFDVSYAVNGVPCQGTAKININKAYDTSVMAVTAALSEARQWAGYASWLPQVADQISATNGAAFGIRGVMQQNLRNSMAFAEAARNYREWSQKTWQGVTDDRNRSIDKRNEQFRDNLGGIQPYSSPYETGKRVELPLTHQYYWMDRQGNIVGTDDPGANPNHGSTGEWRPMKRQQ